MCAGKLRSIWDATSVVLAMMANVNRDPDKQPEPYLPREFNPYRQDDPEQEEEAPQSTGFWQKVSNLRVFEKPDEILKSMLDGMKGRPTDG